MLIYDKSLEDDPELVEAIGVAAGVALENRKLHAEVTARLAELQASRERIVTAADAERRRIERNLHDGAQQRLVTLALQLSLIRREIHRDPNGGRSSSISSASEELARSLAELRELARGIHPAALEHGLDVALEALAQRAAVPTSVVVDDGPRLPQPVEFAAYFVASEALANIAKHAQASAATIRLRRTGHDVEVTITDDGVGGADLTGAPAAGPHRPGGSPRRAARRPHTRRGRNGGHRDAAACVRRRPARLPRPQRPPTTPTASTAMPARMRCSALMARPILAPSWSSLPRSSAQRQVSPTRPSTTRWMKIAANTCVIPRPGTPKKLSCSHVFVPRTTTRSPAATTSSTVQVWRTGPICRNSSCTPARPGGRPGGPPCMVQSSVTRAHRPSRSCAVTRSRNATPISCVVIMTGIVPILTGPRRGRRHHLTRWLPGAARRPRPAGVRGSREDEAALWFCVLEALRNAAKHAAEGVVVELSVTGDRMQTEVRDRGPGFDPAAAPTGSGLTNMADRMAAVDGTLEIHSAPGCGTRVVASAPTG